MERFRREYIKGQNEAKRILRSEVGFGCPICRNPILTYHHFDPPWHIEHHWNPEGMIALCREHHDLAEGGHYTKAEIHDLKQQKYSIEDIKKVLPWTRNNFVIRLGATYSCGCESVLKIDNESIIEIKTDENGLLSVSFILMAENGEVIAQMNDNLFEFGEIIPHDFFITTTGTRIKIWSESSKVAVDLSLKKVKIEELKRYLHKDFIEAQEQFKSFCEENPQIIPDYLPREIKELIKGYNNSNDNVSSNVIKWAQENCIDSDGCISFLNFENISLYIRGKLTQIKNGSGIFGYNTAINCKGVFNI